MDKKTKNELFEYIKELFLEPSPSGDHKNSLQDILDFCEKKYDDINLSRTTIWRWINKKDRYTKKSIQDIWDESKKNGSTVEIIENETKNKQTNEERLKQSLENKFAELIKRNKILHEKTFKALEEIDYTGADLKDLTQLFTAVSRNLENLLEIKKGASDNEGQEVNIIFSEVKNGNNN